MDLWEQILLGIAALLVLFFWGPAASRLLRASPKADTRQWMSALVPLGLVLLFVLFLLLVQ